MSWLHGIRQRVSDAVATSARNGELEEEIAYHLELETARHIDAGCDPSVARARALARFGNPDHITDATRDERGPQPLEGGMRDLRWALRSLRKNPGFTALALFTLVLGIGATTVAFSVLDTALLRPLPYREPERLVFIREITAERTTPPPSFPNFASWRDEAHSFVGVAAAMYPSSGTVWPSSTATEPLRVPILAISHRFLAILGVNPALGREFSGNENRPGGPPVAMVSYEFWKSQMDGRNPLGSIRLSDGTVPVVGVLPPQFRYVAAADVYLPLEQGAGTMRSAHNYLVIGRLKSSVTLDAAQAEMTALSRSLLATYGTQTAAVDASVIPFRDYLVADYRVILSIVFGAAALVLLVACTNLITAQLARGRMREREVVVRVALGASRARLVRQLLFESMVLVSFGAAVATLLAVAAARVIAAIGGSLVPRSNELSVDGRVLAFVIAIAVATALLVGVYPALRLADRDPGTVLHSRRSAGLTVRAPVWRLLVGFEIALAVLLLIGSTLLIRTLHNILTADTGFDAHGIVTAEITPHEDRPGQLDQIRRELEAQPGVEGVGFTNRLPFTWGNTSAPVRRLGDPVDHEFPTLAGFRVVSAGYFAVLRQPILRGRGFTDADRGGAAQVAVITSGIAERLWPGRNPIGQTIATNYLMKEWLTVVGVVTEASSWSMERGSQNEIFVPLAQHPTQTEGQLVAVIRTTGNPHALIPMVRARLRQLAPNVPAQLSTMDDRIASSAADRRFAMLAVTTFGVIALSLAGVGIYGVIWYMVATTTHEIGIRMALGATAAMVKRDVLRGAALMAAGGIFAGAAAGMFATRYLQSTLYGLSRFDPATYAIGSGAAMAIALLASYVPARRSSRVDPMVAIRGE